MFIKYTQKTIPLSHDILCQRDADKSNYPFHQAYSHHLVIFWELLARGYFKSIKYQKVENSSAKLFALSCVTSGHENGDNFTMPSSVTMLATPFQWTLVKLGPLAQLHSYTCTNWYRKWSTKNTGNKSTEKVNLVSCLIMNMMLYYW